MGLIIARRENNAGDECKAGPVGLPCFDSKESKARQCYSLPLREMVTEFYKGWSCWVPVSEIPPLNPGIIRGSKKLTLQQQ